MLPGPIKIYECPKCKNLISNDSLASGNTFGSILYSDGKSISPMLPEYPVLTKCSKCKTFIWLDKIKPIKEIYYGDYSVDFNEFTKARFLSVYDYITALKANVFYTIKEELFIRQRILWGFNDRVRNNQPLFKLDKDKDLYYKNIDRCIELLLSQEPYIDDESIDQNILLAELYRLKGAFELCILYINFVNNKDYDWIKLAFEKECDRKNTTVFQLN